jgi:uncharacterized protein
MTRIIAVRLTPKASSNRIGEIRSLPDGTEQLAIYVTAVPESGKANDAMLKLLSKHLGLAKSRLAVIKGATSRDKLVEILV